MKRGIYADSMDKKSVVTILLGYDGSVYLEDGIACKSMNQWLQSFDNRRTHTFFAVPEDIPAQGQRGWDNTWCVLRCSGCHRTISCQRDWMHEFQHWSRLTDRGHAPMATQMASIPVNVAASEFFDGICWGEKPCIDADPRTYGADVDGVNKLPEPSRTKNLEELNGRMAPIPRIVLGYATRTPSEKIFLENPSKLEDDEPEEELLLNDDEE